MRIRITAVTGVADGEGNRYAAGSVVEVPDAKAKAWVAAGHAKKAPAPAPAPASSKRTATNPPESRRKGSSSKG